MRKPIIPKGTFIFILLNYLSAMRIFYLILTTIGAFLKDRHDFNNLI